MNLLRTLRTFGMQEWRSSSNVLKTAGQFRMCSAEAGESEEAETPVDPAKDRRIPTPLEVGLRYMESKAYQTTYGELPVYTEYRRNHKGQLPPKKTRKSCTRKQMISTGNPCPICRDEYLVLEPENVKLLKQFISEHTGQVNAYTYFLNKYKLNWLH